MRQVGIWIDHKKAVIVILSEDGASSTTVASDVGPHSHFAGSQEGGGEKKYEERRVHELNRYYDSVISHVGDPDALLLMGPGEAKVELKARIGRSPALVRRALSLVNSDKLTRPQIVARVKAHFEVGG